MLRFSSGLTIDMAHLDHLDHLDPQNQGAGASGGAATDRAPERNDPWRFPGRNPEVLPNLAGHGSVGQHLGTSTPPKWPGDAQFISENQNGLVMFSSYLKK